MIKFELLQVQDLKEAAAIERRKRYEEDRKKRIFNARNRLLGVDYDTLQKQIHEKQQREQEEKERNEKFADEQKHLAKIALEYERQYLEEKRQINQDINNFRHVFQRPEDRREFDLYDPKGLQKSLPARIDDNDPRCSISSAQKFEGEDLASDVRRKLQKEQTKAWLQQQMKEHKTAQDELKAAEEAYQRAVIERDKRAVELEGLENECRRRVQEATTRFNQSLLEFKKNQENVKTRQEFEDKFAEMYNAVTGDFLTENPSTAQSNFGPNRPIAYMYKGMTPEERQAVRQQQLRQMQENKQKRDEEERLKKYWDDFNIDLAKQGIQMESEQRMKQREMSKQLSDFNKSLSKEQKAYKQYLDQNVYTNKPTAAYFAQFNTTTR